MKSFFQLAIFGSAFLTFVGCTKETTLSKRLDGDWTVSACVGKAAIQSPFGYDTSTVNLKSGSLSLNRSTGKGSMKLYVNLNSNGFPMEDSIIADITSWNNTEGTTVNLVTSYKNGKTGTWSWTVVDNASSKQIWKSKTPATAVLLNVDATVDISNFEISKNK
jgi:hypothetical protein